MTLTATQRARLARIHYETDKQDVNLPAWDKLPFGTQYRKLEALEAVLQELDVMQRDQPGARVVTMPMRRQEGETA